MNLSEDKGHGKNHVTKKYPKSYRKQISSEKNYIKNYQFLKKVWIWGNIVFNQKSLFYIVSESREEFFYTTKGPA